jgi:hypothetical protein
MRSFESRSFTLAVTLATLASTVGPAVAEFNVVPNALAAVEGNQASEFLTGDGAPAIHYQQVFAASQFSGPGVITELAFRPDAVRGDAFSATLPNTRISLSTTSKVPDGLSATFADNLGPDETVVYNGNLTLSSSDAPGPGGTRAFDIVVALSSPFSYDPSLGNLLLDFQRDGSTLNPLGESFDAQDQFGDSISRAFGSRASATATRGADTFGVVVRFTMVPEPASLVMLGSVIFILCGRNRRRRSVQVVVLTASWPRYRFLSVFLVVCSWSTCVSVNRSHAMLITNGSFETGDFSGWTKTGNVFVVPSLASDGTYSAHFNRFDFSPNGTIAQEFSTSIGVEYEVRFDHAVISAGFLNQRLFVDVLGNNVLLNQSVTDSSITSATDPNPSFEAFAFRFVADSTLTNVSFRDDNGNQTGSTDTILDNIRVSAVVPESNTLHLAGIVILATVICLRARSLQERSKSSSRTNSVARSPAWPSSF